jgi:hypothetical protein
MKVTVHLTVCDDDGHEGIIILLRSYTSMP